MKALVFLDPHGRKAAFENITAVHVPLPHTDGEFLSIERVEGETVVLLNKPGEEREAVWSALDG